MSRWSTAFLSMTIRSWKKFGRSIPIHMGLSQCHAFFRSHPFFAGRSPVANTAEAARMVAERKKRTLAAVAGIQAAETYGLSVLMRGIQTNQSNYTRFVIIGKKRNQP